MRDPGHEIIRHILLCMWGMIAVMAGLVVLFPDAGADRISFHGGLATSVSGLSPETTQKIGAVRYQHDWTKWFNLQLSAGGWYGDHESLFASLSPGVRVGTELGLYGSFHAGPGYVTNPGPRLATPFEFVLTSEIGIRNDPVGLGISYQHVSNAGIRQPNRGRDFVLGSLQFYF